MEDLKYTNDGWLEPGLHHITANQFIDLFCGTDTRKKYEKAVVNIFDYAKAKGATRIIIGGSFITNKETPRDLDCLIVFRTDRQIPSYVDCAQMEEVSYDILYASEQTPNTIDTYIRLMQTTIHGITNKGVTEVALWDAVDPWEIHYQPSEDDLEVVKRAYCDRTIIERNKRRGVLVVVHGINTNAAWLSNLIPDANNQGWIVAPFIYDNPKRLLFTSGLREEVLEKFRAYLYQ